MDERRISEVTPVPGTAPVCTKCGGTTRIEHGLCLSCLLERSLEPAVEKLVDEAGAGPENNETLDDVLAEIGARSSVWRLGNYQILGEIGRGGMGVIYRARQRYSGRLVAIKRLLGYHSDSRETLARFRREAQAAATLDHPNILPIFEIGETDDGVPFFSMKLATGGTLADAAPELKNDPRRSVSLMARVARAVEYAHEKGILHRDLKPANILLDGQGNPLVSDFGLAKWLDATSDITRTLTIFGTPGYIAPEQASDANAPTAPTADIYSLGAILFDLLAGRPPFLGSHALSVIRQAAEKPAPKLRSLCEVTDRDLETICARCLDRESSARYQSAGQLAEDLERWLDGRPIVARPVSVPTRAWRWSKRNPGLAAAITVIALLGAGGLVAGITNSRLSSIVERAEMAQRSIVVVPFENLDDTEVNGGFEQTESAPGREATAATKDSAEEATQAWVEALTSAKGIQVARAVPLATEDGRDPWSPDHWKAIGEKAGARMILSGSVRTREGKPRVALRMIEGSTGEVLKTWVDQGAAVAEPPKPNETVVRQPPLPTTEGLQLVSEIVRLLDDPKASSAAAIPGDTANPAARSYYERGKEFFFRYNLPDQLRAIESFRKAIELDPNYAEAHAMLATACQLRAVTDPGGGWEAESDKAVEAALRLAPMLPEAHSAMAGRLRNEGRYREALDPLLTAYELDPSNSRTAAKIAGIYAMLGRPDLALRWYGKAARRETRPIYEDNIADAWATLGEFDKAEKAFRLSGDFRPDLPVSPLGLSMIALYRGDIDGARQQCAAARLKYRDHPQPLIMAALIEFFGRQFGDAEKLYREAMISDRTGGLGFVGAVRFLSGLGFIRREAGAIEEGKALLEEAGQLDERELQGAPGNPERLYDLAANQAALGDRAGAITMLGRVVEAGWIDFRPMEMDPRFDSIREAPVFKQIIVELKQKVEAMRETAQGATEDLNRR